MSSESDPHRPALPTDSQARKNIPLFRGCFAYFPNALAAVAEVSRAGNEKHNPGEPMHHARGKSMDHADCILRHLVDHGTIDPEDGLRHSAKAAWRALALLQEELEAAGAPLARGARLPDEIERTPLVTSWVDGPDGKRTYLRRGLPCPETAVPACTDSGVGGGHEARSTTAFCAGCGHTRETHNLAGCFAQSSVQGKLLCSCQEWQ